MITKYIETNGIRLFVVEEGPRQGPLVLLLHGFPEYWGGWRRQIDALAAAGYRVWAPDLRGYHLSDKPKGVDEYRLDKLAGDVLGLIDAAGVEKALLVGHDWGAAVAWWAAYRQPERIEKMVVMSAPHPQVLMETLRNSWEQRRKSWYMYLFRLRYVPESVLGARNWRGLENSMRSTARPDTFSDEEMAQYRKAWAQPGALTAMINYYRALFAHRPGLILDSSINVPTLMIMGEQDEIMVDEMAQTSIGLCEEGALVTIPEATHWLHHEQPGQINELLLDFFENGFENVVAERATPLVSPEATTESSPTTA